jgi:hypothetical protein
MIERPHSNEELDALVYRVAKGLHTEQEIEQLLATYTVEQATAIRELIESARRGIAYGAFWSEVVRLSEATGLFSHRCWATHGEMIEHLKQRGLAPVEGNNEETTNG